VPTLKFIFVVPVIFKLDDEELIIPLILFKFELIVVKFVLIVVKFVLIVVKFVLILPKDDNILMLETVNDDMTETLSDVMLLHIKSFAPLDDNIKESIIYINIRLK